MNDALFFPQPLRDFRGQRWVRISIRTLHLISMGLLVGGVARGAAPADLQWEVWSTLLTGLAFVAVELYGSCIWLFQLKGWAVIVKMLLLASVLAAPHSALPLLIVAIVIGGISSHMPGKYRYYSPLHGRVIKA